MKTSASLLFLELFRLAFALPFRDVSTTVGMKRQYGPRVKYGGAIVADFNGDGYPDLLIGHHDQFSADLYFNQRNGKFRRAPWNFWKDTHAFVPFRATPTDGGLHFLTSTGGRNGNKPTSPLVYSVSKNRVIKNEGRAQFAAGRGRSIIPIALDTKTQRYPDFLILNAQTSKKWMKQYFGMTVVNRRFPKQGNLRGFDNVQNSYGTVADVDMDGRMELLTFQNMRVHRVVRYFTLKDVTKYVLPAHLDLRGVVSVAELDYNNDGKMDLYIARSATNDLKWLQRFIGNNPRDYLLKNVGGRFVDVSGAAEIGPGGPSRGVTVGDFNNDGWVDILVTQFTGPDRLLLNRGNGTFSLSQPQYYKSRQTRGDQPVAVDYDRDGLLDVILSEGSFFKRNHGGFMRIMKNVGVPRNWILVRVGSSPSATVTSMHALVTVKAAKMSMIRRVGSPGTAVGSSFIELVHFGLGDHSSSVLVSVKWTDQSEQTLRAVQPNQVVSIGKIN